MTPLCSAIAHCLHENCLARTASIIANVNLLEKQEVRSHNCLHENCLAQIA
ncbi:MAG: hypothetical protein V7K14_07620 [Nostoc sp.]|uniref:hypothetical protein n=1 Tax=Nostoc sp. TaxID=1180 RepID=UPI002FF44008